MLGNTLDELPLRRLYAIAKELSFRIAITIDGPKGKTYLDTLDVWDGKPGRIGSRLMGRVSLIDHTVDSAALEIIEKIA